MDPNQVQLSLIHHRLQFIIQNFIYRIVVELHGIIHGELMVLLLVLAHSQCHLIMDHIFLKQRVKMVLVQPLHYMQIMQKPHLLNGHFLVHLVVQVHRHLVEVVHRHHLVVQAHHIVEVVHLHHLVTQQLVVTIMIHLQVQMEVLQILIYGQKIKLVELQEFIIINYIMILQVKLVVMEYMLEIGI